MKKILGVIIFSLFLYGCPSTEVLNTTGVWQYPWPQGLNKNQFIEKYFAGKSLDSVEGVYIGSNK
jgi:hypothetical protein